jgi:uncharacterized protein (DUF3084 family)
MSAKNAPSVSADGVRAIVDAQSHLHDSVVAALQADNAQLRAKVEQLRTDRDRWRHEHRIAAQREREWKTRARRAEAEVERLRDAR